MIIPIIPSNLEQSFEKVKTLSPSQFSQLKDGCQYKCILQRAARTKAQELGIALTYPPNSAALYGSIIHLMYERRMRGLIPDGETFENMWDNEVEKININFAQKYPSISLSNDYAKMFETKKVVMKMTPCVSNSGNVMSGAQPSSQFERPYKIPNMLYGKIDRISYARGVEIIDYKTGQVYDENNNIKQSYIDQLNLYALMYEYTEKTPVDKLTIIDREGNEIDVPRIKDELSLLNSVSNIINSINTNINGGTCISLANASEDNCKFCDCRHLCSAYWESPYLQTSFVRGIVSNSGNRFVSLTLDDGASIRISGIEKLDIPVSEYYIGRQLMFLEVYPSQQSVGQYIVTKNTLVFDYPAQTDPNSVYYSNYLPELHAFVKVALERNYDISKDGGYYVLDDDGIIIAEAAFGIESLKLVVDTDNISKRVFEEKGYTILTSDDINDFINILK